MARPRRPTPPPLETNDVRVAVTGVVAWAVALVVLVLVGLPEADRWWLWVCVTGIAIGLFGVVYIPRLHRSRAAVIAQHAREERGAAAAGAGDDARPDRPAEGTGADQG